MNNILFCKTFNFNSFLFHAPRHTDNSSGLDGNCLSRMKSGEGIIRMLSGTELCVGQGDCFFLPMGLKYHSYWIPSETGDKSVSWDVVKFIYIPDSDGRQPDAQMIPVSKEQNSRLDRLFDHSDATPASVGLLYSLLGEFLPFMKEKVVDEKERLFENIKQYISSNTDFRVAELARAMGMSESGLYTFVREYGKTTPIALKNQIETEKAVQLLTTTDLSIEEISSRLGFCSTVYFRKVFRRETGKTPTELRREYSPEKSV